MRGQRTLLIDLDPQANSSLSYVEARGLEHSMFDVLATANGNLGLKDVVVPTRIANLDLAPARIALAKLEAQLVGELDGPYRLKDRLAALETNYPFVVIDTPPA